MPYELPPTFTGWLLAKVDREQLLDRFPPVYNNVVADHVTFSAPKGITMPGIGSARVVGIADDGRGVQALVVEINGTTDRPDGSTYHMTWSLDSASGRTAQESNDVIREQRWTPTEPIPIALEPSVRR